MTKDKDYKKVLDSLQKDFGWEDTKDMSYMEKDLINDVIKAVKNLNICSVATKRKLLIAYEKNHYTPQDWALASKQCIEDIDNYLAINCG